MPRLHAALFAGAAALVCASAAIAATQEWRTTTVDLPDGSTAEIRYVGDVPPKVTVSMPVVQDPRVAVAEEIYEDIDDTAVPPARRVVQARPQPTLQPPAPPQFVVGGGMPKGSRYHYTLITTGSDGKVCTQRTEWVSRGQDKEPRVTRTDTGEGCAAAAPAAPADPNAI